MASEQEIIHIINRICENRPTSFSQRFDMTNSGIGFVLRLLDEADRPVTAGEISDCMKVSTARVAVLLRKMSEKELIIKAVDPADGRKSLISLSEHGKEEILRVKADFFRLISQVIDRVGIERLEEFIDISCDIRNAVSEVRDITDKTANSKGAE